MTVGPFGSSHSYRYLARCYNTLRPWGTNNRPALPDIAVVIKQNISSSGRCFTGRLARFSERRQ
eukprot:15811438-Heterocapsa_arctica.AAC.1